MIILELLGGAALVAVMIFFILIGTPQRIEDTILKHKVCEPETLS